MSAAQFDLIHAWCDGAAEPNPGPASWAFVLRGGVGGEYVDEQSGYCGIATNNVAEYTAVLRAVEAIMRLNPAKAVIHSDSRLVVEQLVGSWKVKNEKLSQLRNEVFKAASGPVGTLRVQSFSANSPPPSVGSPLIEIVWVPRDENTEADALAVAVLKNLGLDPRGAEDQYARSPRRIGSAVASR